MHARRPRHAAGRAPAPAAVRRAAGAMATMAARCIVRDGATGVSERRLSLADIERDLHAVQCAVTALVVIAQKLHSGVDGVDGHAQRHHHNDASIIVRHDRVVVLAPPRARHIGRAPAARAWSPERRMQKAECRMQNAEFNLDLP